MPADIVLISENKHFLFRRIMGGELVSGVLNERLSPTILPKPKPALVEKLAWGKDWNHGAGLHLARIEFSYFAVPAVRENEPLWLKWTLSEQRFHQETVRVVSGFSGSSRGRKIRKLRRSGKADRRHGSNLYLFHTFPPKRPASRIIFISLNNWKRTLSQLQRPFLS